MWLSFGVQDWEFNFEGCFSLGLSGDEGWCWISFLQWLFFVKESFFRW
jgi:hypothetical protein